MSNYLNELPEYTDLLEQGRRYIEEISSEQWTDYNNHDPGITTLEYLSYALSEMNYLCSFDIKDILARPSLQQLQELEKGSRLDRELESFYNSEVSHFHSCQEVLPNSSLTLNDYRKLLIDLEGIRNAVIKEKNNGVYQAEVELDHPPDNDDGNFTRKHLQTVNRTLNANRNLGDLFLPAKARDHIEIELEVDIEIEGGSNIDAIVFAASFQLMQIVSPRIQFYSLNGMLQKGKSVGEIFNGPLLKNGFIDNTELNKFGSKQVISKYEMIDRLMDIKNILTIREINIHPLAPKQAKQSDAHEHKVDQISEIDWNGNLITLDETISCCIYSIKYVLNYPDEVKALPVSRILVDEINKMRRGKLWSNVKPESLVFKRPQGTFLNIGNYHTIQNHFPSTYGIGEYGLPANATDERKAQAQQFKGYLSIFEQFLADFKAQLININQLYSYFPTHKTYFTQVLSDIKDFQDLIPPVYVIPEGEKEEVELDESEDQKLDRHHNELKLKIETKQQYEVRRNKILDHILARYSVYLDDSLLISNSIYQFDNTGVPSLINDFQESLVYFKELADLKAYKNPDEYPVQSVTSLIVKHKEWLLQQMASITSNRSLGFNLEKRAYGHRSVSGLEEFLRALLDIREKPSAVYFEEEWFKEDKEEYISQSETKEEIPVYSFEIQQKITIDPVIQENSKTQAKPQTFTVSLIQSKNYGCRQERANALNRFVELGTNKNNFDIFYNKDCYHYKLDDQVQIFDTDQIIKQSRISVANKDGNATEQVAEKLGMTADDLKHKICLKSVETLNHILRYYDDDLPLPEDVEKAKKEEKVLEGFQGKFSLTINYTGDDVGKDGLKLLSSKEFKNRKERGVFLDQVIKTGRIADNYSTTEESYSIIDKTYLKNDNPVYSRSFSSAAERSKAQEKLIGILQNYDERNFYLVEHQLLNPEDAEEINDELAFRATVVMPKSLNKYDLPEARAYIEKIIYEHTPSHILVNIIWLDDVALQKFRSLYWDSTLAPKDQITEDQKTVKNVRDQAKAELLEYLNELINSKGY